MKSMIEYPGKTEAEIREINRAFGRRVGNAMLTSLAYIGKGTQPHIAALERMEVEEVVRRDEDDEPTAV